LEAEILEISKNSNKVKENHAEIDMWGEISNGKMKNLWFENEGDFVELKITEQFEKSTLKICAAVGPSCGKFDIYVNGNLETSQDLYSNHPGMTTPFIDLGEVEPDNNAFVLKFVYRGNNDSARSKKGKFALGIDYFVIENDFLKR
jgi:hypothetical protein